MLLDKQDVQTSTDVGQVQDQQTQDVTPTEGQESGSEPLVEDKQGKDIVQELETLRKRVAELEKYEPQAKTEQEIALEQKAAELWNRERNLVLKEHGLEPFAEFIRAEDSEELIKQVDKLKQIISKLKLDGAFVPSSHRLTDKYSLAESKNDTQGMIASKLSTLFK